MRNADTMHFLKICLRGWMLDGTCGAYHITILTIKARVAVAEVPIA
jgi:hypothetical protein